MSALSERLEDMATDLTRDAGVSVPDIIAALREAAAELSEVAPKVRTIQLAHDLSAGTYRVVTVTDSVQYRPGEFLVRDVVAGLCDDAAWKVKVVLEK